MSVRPSKGTLAGVMGLAILGISVSGPLARLADAPPLAIAVWRLFLSLFIVGVPLLVGGSWREWRSLSRQDVGIALAAGAFLALHFWSWIASLGMTSVADSVLLVNLHPVVIVAGSALWLGERPSRRALLGLAIAVIGAAIVAWPESGDIAGDIAGHVRGEDSGDIAEGVAGGVAGDVTGSASRAALRATGNALAVLGAITVGLYYLAGRRLRQQLSLWPYVGLVYGACFLVLLLLAGLTRTPLWPYAPRELGIFLLIALGPMLAGHTGFNWALRYVPAFVVSIALLAEPVGAAAIAALLPAIGEMPDASTIIGGAVLLIGLVVAYL